MPSFDPIVYYQKQVFMQRLSDSAGAGYVDYVAGQITLDRAATVVRKFGELYQVAIKKDARYRRKLAGLGSAVLHLWQPKPNHPIHYVLMVSDGDHPARQLEPLRNVLEQSINVTGYELVRPLRQFPAKQVWTWRISKEGHEAWRNRIVSCCRLVSPAPASAAYVSLYKSPGFSGVRSQIGHLVKFFRTEWKRRKGNQPFFPPRKLFYCQRLPTTGLKLSSVLRGYLVYQLDMERTRAENDVNEHELADFNDFLVQDALQAPLVQLQSDTVADRLPLSKSSQKCSVSRSRIASRCEDHND